MALRAPQPSGNGDRHPSGLLVGCSMELKSTSFSTEATEMRRIEGLRKSWGKFRVTATHIKPETDHSPLARLRRTAASIRMSEQKLKGLKLGTGVRTVD